MHDVRHLAVTIGPRPAGSASETRARDHLRTRLEGLGAPVETRTFTFRGWRALGPPRVEVGDASLDAVTVPYTFGTPPDGVEGALRFEGEWPIIPGRLSCPRFRLEDETGETRAAILASPAGKARSAMPASDHWAFHELGVPSAQLTRVPDLEWHSDGDLSDRFDDAALDDAETVATRLIEGACEELGLE
jgi:hypothetical protein